MANESPAAAGNEPKKGQPQQEPKTSEQQQTRSAAASSQQQPGARREQSSGALARRGYDPGALASAGFITSPFSLMRRMMDDLDRMFEEVGFGPGGGAMGRRELQRAPSRREAIWAPSVDVFERNGKLVVRADLPGLKKDDVRVEVAEGALVIEGERREEREFEGGGVYRAERVQGSFQRVIPLPEGVDTESAEARFESGVLEVSLRLSEEKGRGRRIEIQEGKQPSVH
ncbi:MAG TPA: Hsp20/alpha crystallin family protein [Anaeromyxobacter sp.]